MKLFAGLEADRFSGGDGDFGPCSGIASNAGLARLDGEDAEAAEFNAVAGDEVLLHAFEDGVDGSLCFCSWQTGTLNNPLYKILLNHFGAAILGCIFCNTLLTGFSNVMVESRREIVNVRTLP
jgi:hypothetical protein